MKTHRTLPIVILLCAAFASCGRIPTDTAAAPDGASYDGVTIGSGNRAGGGEAGTMDGGTMQSDSTGRGVTIGSGN